MNLEEMKKLAVSIFKAKEGDEIHGKTIDENTVYFYQHIRGGKQIIIGSDGNFLFGTSALSFDELLKEYSSGKRSK